MRHLGDVCSLPWGNAKCCLEEIAALGTQLALPLQNLWGNGALVGGIKVQLRAEPGSHIELQIIAECGFEP